MASDFSEEAARIHRICDEADHLKRLRSVEPCKERTIAKRSGDASNLLNGLGDLLASFGGVLIESLTDFGAGVLAGIIEGIFS